MIPQLYVAVRLRMFVVRLMRKKSYAVSFVEYVSIIYSNICSASSLKTIRVCFRIGGGATSLS